MAEPKRQWTYIPPAWTGTQVEGTGMLPFGRYQMPDGTEQVSFGLPQPLLDAVRAVGYAGGREQDPAAPQGYVSQNALQRGAEGLAGSAAVGSLGVRAPRGALRSGAARSKFGQELDASVPARAQRALDMGFEDQAVYRGMKEAYDPDQASFKPQWFSSDPETASSYAPSGEFQVGNTSPQVMPAYVRPGRMIEVDAGGRTYDEIPVTALPQEFFDKSSVWSKFRDDPNRTVTTDTVVRYLMGENQPDTVRFRNVRDHSSDRSGAPSDVTVVLNPANIRSTQAMFDPARINETDPLAANPLAGAIPLAWRQDAGMTEEDDNPQRAKRNRLLERARR